jgi:uncharacterized protein GlcG (DUF336 family)
MRKPLTGSCLIKRTTILFMGVAALWTSSMACAQTAPISTPLTLAMSMDALNEAILVCNSKGYKVTAAVVDADGIIKVQARGDGSPIHSQNFSFRKAYTIVSMGPEFGVDTSSALIALLDTKVANISGGSTELLFLPGAVTIKSGKEVIGAIGVSGAPQSSEDEICAQAGVDKIRTGLQAGQKPG